MERRSAEPQILALLKESAEEGLITYSQMSKGFGRLADTVDDLSLDIINAKDMFESLVLKATTEGWLSPASVKSIPSEQNGPSENDNARLFKERAVSIIQEYFLSDDISEVTRSLEDLAAPDFNAVFVKRLITLAMDRKNREKEMASVLLSALYTEVFPVEDAKDKINKLLEEYETGGDIGEACQCIRDLNMPFFHHEVVKKALVMAMEKKNDRLLNLLQECSSEGLITINQMMKGFTRVVDSLDDLALDIPNAREKFASYVEHAKVNGWLVSSFTYGAKSDPAV